jgi:hypothetical protein
MRQYPLSISSARHVWLFTLQLDIGRKNCIEGSACFSLKELRYKYPYQSWVLVSLWDVLWYWPECRIPDIADSLRD